MTQDNAKADTGNWMTVWRESPEDYYAPSIAISHDLQALRFHLRGGCVIVKPIAHVLALLDAEASPETPDTLSKIKELLDNQHDLPPEAAKVLRDNLWNLYDGVAEARRTETPQGAWTQEEIDEIRIAAKARAEKFGIKRDADPPLSEDT